MVVMMMINITIVSLVMYTLILLWGVGTTTYGLYLSRKNNEEYNKKIVVWLERIYNEVKKDGNN